MDFYKKFGFKVNSTVEKYYKRIQPDDAYVLEKDLDEDDGACVVG